MTCGKSPLRSYGRSTVRRRADGAAVLGPDHPDLRLWRGALAAWRDSPSDGSRPDRVNRRAQSAVLNYVMGIDSPSVATDVGLRALYDAQVGALYRLALALTTDRDLAEDLVHDAFVRFHRLDGPARPAPGTEAAYLRRTVTNLAHDHHRHLAVTRRHASLTPGPDSQAEGSAEDQAFGSDQDRAVASAVAALPDRQRQCVVLHYFAGLSDAAIAAELGVATGSVKTHLHRARATLATTLQHLRGDHR